MAQIVAGAQTVRRQGDIVVFVIGARINKWWLLPLSLPILSRMNAMLAELSRDPDSGFLGVQPLGFGSMVQYWRSVDDLLRYANARDREHRPAAKRFFQKLFANQAVGVWHETYAVPAGHYEASYANMPRVGLGKLSELVEARGELARAQNRLCPEALEVGRTTRQISIPAASPDGGGEIPVASTQVRY
jgi:hypothetical protein